MPRERHSSSEYLCWSSTDWPQVPHLVTRFAFSAPHSPQMTLSSFECPVSILAPQLVHDIRTYSSPFSSPQRQCQSPIE